MQAPNGKYDVYVYSNASTAKSTVKKVDDPSVRTQANIEMSVSVDNVDVAKMTARSILS